MSTAENLDFFVLAERPEYTQSCSSQCFESTDQSETIHDSLDFAKLKIEFSLQHLGEFQ